MYVIPHPASELSERVPPAPSCPRIPRGIPVMDSPFRSPLQARHGTARPAGMHGRQGGPFQQKAFVELMRQTALPYQFEQRLLRSSARAAPSHEGAGEGSGQPRAPALAVTAEERRGSQKTAVLRRAGLRGERRLLRPGTAFPEKSCGSGRARGEGASLRPVTSYPAAARRANLVPARAEPRQRAVGPALCLQKKK